eukprot:scaffold4986_cov180-Alexandrium_tamarense.AAC.7
MLMPAQSHPMSEIGSRCLPVFAWVMSPYHDAMASSLNCRRPGRWQAEGREPEKRCGKTR